MGQSPDSASYNTIGEGIPLVQGNADIKNRVSSPNRHTSKPTKICRPNSVLLSVRAPVGTVGIADQTLCLGRGVCAIESDNNDFLYQYLIFKEDSWRNIEQGGTFTAINGDDIKKFVYIMPCEIERKKISAFLSLLDSRIAAQRRLVELLKKHKRGLIQRLFSDENSSHKLHFTYGKDLCHSVMMGKLGKFFGGLSGKTKEDFGHGNSLYVTYMNVYKNVVAMLEDCEMVDVSDNETQHPIIAGDIMFTQSSETIEEVGLASLWEHDKNPYLNSFCFAFRLYNQHNIIPKWFVYFMRSPQVRKLIMREGQGITRVNLSSERMKSIMLDIPNTTEQGKVASVLDLCDSKINLATKELEFLNTLKHGLLQQLFV